MTNNKKQQPQPQEDRVHPTIEKAQQLEGEELVEFLSKIHPIDVYIIQRDHLTQLQVKTITSNPKLRGWYKDIIQGARSAWQRYHSTATIGEVEKMIQQTVNATLKYVLDQMDMIKKAVNENEKELGIPVTLWEIKNITPNNEGEDNEQPKAE